MMFLCSVSIIASATDYYVSSSGNDSANGLSSSTPWQSISKVNSVFPGLNPGDRILFKRGDLFYGTLKITRLGSLGSPITISAYGTGNNPVISGFTTIVGWNSYGNGIYYKAVSCESKPNMVTVNGVNTPIGRWPNEGLLTINSHTTNTSISDAELSSSPNWSGAEIIIRKNQYIWDRNKIIAHSDNTISYASGSDYNAGDGYGYFIQNDLKTLDQQGEWFYDGSNFYMYFGSNNPENFIIKVSSTDQLAFLENTDFISIESIAFEGANNYALQIKNSDNVTIQNCSINFTGNTAIFGPYSGTSTNCKIINNSITNSNNKAISLSGDHSSATVTDNRIINTGIIIGMGESGDGTYSAVEIGGANSTIQNNSIENSGYIAINFSRNNVLVANNLINTFNLVKNDGGGIYTYVGTGVSYTGQKITGNIVLNGMGYGDGLPHNEFHSCGIYMDDRVRNVIITNNTISNCNSTGLYLHNAHEIDITGNTFYNNGSGRTDYGGQILFVHDTYSPDDPIRNIMMNNNIFFAKTSAQLVLAFCTTNNDIPSLGTSDYNCFAKPIDDTFVAKTWNDGWNGAATNRSLSNWKLFTGKDINSYASPIAISDVSKIRFEYNASNSNKTVSLDGSYIDVKGAKYSGSLTLLPYTSVVLMVDPDSSNPPPGTNTAPVVVVDSFLSANSGFIGELNASKSYDADKDNLTFTWEIPGNIPVSANNTPVIEYLAPIVDVKHTFEFTVTVSDGKTTQSKTIPVEILPYQPGLEAAEVISVEASGYQSPYYPYNVIDGNLATFWSTNGIDQWVILKLETPFSIQHIKMAFQPGQKKESYFDVLVLNDEEKWEPVLIKSKSCAFSGDLQVFDFPPSKTEQEYRYIKLVGLGNSLDDWNYISEVRIFGYRHKNPLNYEDLLAKTYPNPANEFVNILIDEPTFNPDFVKIVSFTGKILYNGKIEPGIRQLLVPINLKQGIYIVQLGTGEFTMFTQKLIVIR